MFPHSDWIRRDTPHLTVFSPITGKCEKNADQNNSEYGHFLRSVNETKLFRNQDHLTCDAFFCNENPVLIISYGVDSRNFQQKTINKQLGNFHCICDMQ